MRTKLLATLCLAALAGAAAAQERPFPGFAVERLEAAEFAALHARVLPGEEDAQWLQIPWETDLLAARERAARERKPLLLWVMDGHPLGCT